MKKENYLVLVLWWGIVAYAVTLLSYFTLKVFNHGAEYISAFSSMLSAVGTFFAAFVAVFLFSKWKKQAIYLDAIKLISQLNLGIQSIFEELELLRQVHNYEQYFNQIKDLNASRVYGEHDSGILSGEELQREKNKFCDNFIPIMKKKDLVIERFEELGTYLDYDLKDEKIEVFSHIKSVEDDIFGAYVQLMQSHLGVGSLQNSIFKSDIQPHDILYINSVLGSLNILVEHLSPFNKEKYSAYFKKIDHMIRDVETNIFFNYDDFIIATKNNIRLIIKKIRDDHLE